MEAVLRNTLLYDFYGDLLTQKQRDIYHMYFCEDMSLAEIGSRCGISRQAVNFSLKQTQKNFDAFEGALKLVERYAATRQHIADLRCAIESKDYSECTKILSVLDDMTVR
ncbi:MAG: hypothetical protein FWC76_05815 [Defluviitaleaceae bacterium]|nr:hypothetical protein [Defluviitaleaceae bacterium]